LRPLHLDELPQLWNIFIGDMSFVGPRPAMIDTIKEIRSQIPLFEIRQMIRPGLTGLAQISQGYSLDSKDELYEKLGFDLFYIRHYSLAFDLWIMVRTAFNLAKKAW
jgi:lipopolysaccharide/colanic/teichoic acid biosynthesis glycosyltransferase